MVSFKKNRNTKPRRGDKLTAGPRIHHPVMLSEVLRHVPKNAQRIIDATLGVGGHAAALLERSPKAELLGIDQDEAMATMAKKNLSQFSDRVNIIAANFRDLDLAAKDIGWDWADVILFDLGVASPQLDDPTYGLSFQRSGPLDMRLDRTQGLTAAEIVNSWREEDIVRILREQGEERFARPIAKAIVSKRPLVTTTDVASTVGDVIPASVQRRMKVHPATNTFRALRMTVNSELEALQEALPKSIKLLAPGGTLMVISFHSLEDRIVKRTFKGSPELDILTKKPLRPRPGEINRNPRARSAKLRVAMKQANSE